MSTLQERFLDHPDRHPGVAWEDVAAALDDAARDSVRG